MGLSYAQVGKLFGFAKSTLCKWIRGERLREDSLSGDVLERTGYGRERLRVLWR